MLNRDPPLLITQIALDTAYWTVFNHIMIWGSLLVYFVLQFSYNYLLNGEYIGTLDKVTITNCAYGTLTPRGVLTLGNRLFWLTWKQHTTYVEYL